MTTHEPTGQDEREALPTSWTAIRAVVADYGWLTIVGPDADGMWSSAGAWHADEHIQSWEPLLTEKQWLSRTPDPAEVPPGPCWAPSPAVWPDGFARRCELRAGHAGAHECDRGSMGGTVVWMSTGQSEADIRAEAIKTWANLVRSELEATRIHGIELGDAYLEGMHSALRQAEDHAARLLNDAPPRSARRATGASPSGCGG